MFRFKSLNSTTIVITMFLLQSCFPGTTFKGTKFCPAYLEEGDAILVGALPMKNWESQVASIRKELKDRKTKVLYAPEEEWNLRAAGILNPLDTIYYTRLMEKGITHILLVSEVSAKEGILYDYKSPYEIAQEQNPFYPNTTTLNESDYSAELKIQLISVRTKQFYSFHATSQINGMQMDKDDGGRTTVNAGSVDQARNVAIRKSAKRIAKYCR